MEKRAWAIPVSWELCTEIIVRADTLTEAMRIASEKQSAIRYGGDYVYGSYGLWDEDVESVREIYNGGAKDLV